MLSAFKLLCRQYSSAFVKELQTICSMNIFVSVVLIYSLFEYLCLALGNINILLPSTSLKFLHPLSIITSTLTTRSFIDWSPTIVMCVLSNSASVWDATAWSTFSPDRFKSLLGPAPGFSYSIAFHVWLKASL